MTKKAAFTVYGIHLKTPYSWAGKRQSDGAIGITLWSHELDYSQKPPLYTTGARDPKNDWTKRPDSKEKKLLLAEAITKFGGEFYVVMLTAEDVAENPLTIKNAHAATNMRGRVVTLDDETGEFTAETISPADAKYLADI
jgi:hypothetical protein